MFALAFFLREVHLAMHTVRFAAPRAISEPRGLRRVCLTPEDRTNSQTELVHCSYALIEGLKEADVARSLPGIGAIASEERESSSHGCG